MWFTGFDSASVMGPARNSPTDICILRYDRIFIRWTKRCETANDSRRWAKEDAATVLRLVRLAADCSLFKPATCESGTSLRVNEVWWDKSIFGACCLRETVSWRSAVMKRLSPWLQVSSWLIYIKKKKRSSLVPVTVKFCSLLNFK